MAETYKIKVACRNCDFEGEVDIEKSIEVKEAICPQCGCTTLTKSSTLPNII